MRYAIRYRQRGTLGAMTLETSEGALERGVEFLLGKGCRIIGVYRIKP